MLKKILQIVSNIKQPPTSVGKTYEVDEMRIFIGKNGYITKEDICGTAAFTDANGDISEGTIINLRKIKFGEFELTNVRASVVHNQVAPLLLGQSVLGRLGRITIDNKRLCLIITHKKSTK